MPFTHEQIKVVAKARNNFTYFVKEIGSKSISNFVMGEYVEEACRFLSKSKKTIRLAFRSGMKSQLIHLFLMYKIMFEGINDNIDMHYFSYKEDLAGLHIREVKRMIADNPYFEEIIDLKSRADSIGEFTWDRRHIISIRPRGIISATRGLKGNVLICDDILSDPAQPILPNLIFKVNDLFKSVILESIKPGGEIHVVGCVTKDTRVLTTKGLEKIGNLPMPYHPNTFRKLFMRVYGIDGFHATSHSYNEGIVSTKKIETKSGYSIECSLEHPLLVMDRDGKQCWRKTEDLQIGDWMAIQRNQQEFGYNEELTENEAYLMGLWIAEGSLDRTGRSHRFSICNSDDEIKEFLANIGWNKSNGRSDIYRKNSVELYKRWKKFSCKFVKSYLKTIPEIIFQSRKNLVIKFLQGLYDGDGCNTGNNVVLTSTSLQMIREVQIILLNFGIIAHIRNKGIVIGGIGRNGDRIIGKHICYQLSADGQDAEKFHNEIGFGLTRKQGIRKIRKNSGGHPVPYQNKLIKDIVIKRGGWSSDTDNRDIILSETLERLLLSDIYKVKINKTYSQVLNNLKYFWNEIKEIKDGKAEVVDFVIPKTHSFLSNGFISHNSPISRVDLYFDPELRNEFKFMGTPSIIDKGTPKERSAWPEFISLEELKAKEKSRGPRVFEREFQISPYYSEDSFFKKDYLRKNVINSNLSNTDIRTGYLTAKKVIAGFDVGKKRHPSLLVVFELNGTKAKMIHFKFMDKWAYFSGKDEWDLTHPTQLEYLKEAIKAFNIDELYYDNTRGEFEAAMDQGLIPPTMIPIVSTHRIKEANATAFDKSVMNREMEIIDDDRLITSITQVTKELFAIEDKYGNHGEGFTSIALCFNGINKIFMSGTQEKSITAGGMSVFDTAKIPKGF